MKITAVEAFHVDWGAGRNRSAWVRIRTDAGVDGLGEASPMVHGNASLEIVASAFTPMLRGADPLQARVIRPFSWLIRIALLRAVAREATGRT